MYFFKNNEKNPNIKIFEHYFFLISFVLAIYLVYYVYLSQNDMARHLDLINFMLEKHQLIPHFLWHMSVYLTSILTGLPIFSAALGVSAFFITLMFVIKYKFFSLYVEDQLDYKLIFLLTLLSMIVMPFYIPFFNEHLYLGQGGVGIWHSPTLLVVKPFALLSVLLIFQFLEQTKIKTMLILLLVLMLSILAKPIFIIIFIPSLISYLFIKKNSVKLDAKLILFISFLLVFSAIILIFQYYITYYAALSTLTQRTGIIISPGTVWRSFSPNIFISILITIPFSIFVWVGAKKKSKYLIFSWLLAFWGGLQQYLFAEIDQNHNISLDGNFFWSYLCAQDLLFFFSLIYYVKYYKQYKKSIYLGNLLLLLQGISGVIYIKHLVIDKLPY